MEDRIQRSRLRFMSMLESAELSADWAVSNRPTAMKPATLAAATLKAMSRAAGFLEAISIALPELGPELLAEFEAFGVRVESLLQVTERRAVGGSGSRDDRRTWDRRLVHDRRRRSMAMAVERRLTPSRRGAPDRRAEKIRELADRRWRAVQG
ncbi:MAG TPA: hypothetical protein VIP09_14670 [Dehalococcoidia bacterium]